MCTFPAKETLNDVSFPNSVDKNTTIYVLRCIYFAYYSIKNFCQREKYRNLIFDNFCQIQLWCKGNSNQDIVLVTNTSRSPTSNQKEFSDVTQLKLKFDLPIHRLEDSSRSPQSFSRNAVTNSQKRATLYELKILQRGMAARQSVIYRPATSGVYQSRGHSCQRTDQGSVIYVLGSVRRHLIVPTFVRQSAVRICSRVTRDHNLWCQIFREPVGTESIAISESSRNREHFRYPSSKTSSPKLREG